MSGVNGVNAVVDTRRRTRQTTMMNTPSPVAQQQSQEEEVGTPVVSLIEDDDEADEQDEEVRRLALALAPQVQELDELLTSPPPLDSARGSSRRNSFSEKQHDDDDDDDLGSEEGRLEASEQLLRQELEFAQDWSHLMASPLKEDHLARELALNYGVTEQQEEEQVVVTEEVPSVQTQEAYTIETHAETLGITRDAGWYVLQHSKLSTDVHEFIVPVPFEQLKRLYIGIVGEQGETTPVLDHSVEHEDASGASGGGTPAHATSHTTPASNRSRFSIVNRVEPLPVRTIVIDVRPDVLCGAVMDAIHHSLDGRGEITKRQGNVLRGVVAPCVVTNADTGYTMHYPGYLVDVQLCTYKGNAGDKHGQRSLILRIYHYFGEVQTDEEQSVPSDSDQSYNALLKEASALVQKMETGSTDIGRKSSSSFVSMFSPKIHQHSEGQSPQQIVSQQLLLGYRACPSVLDGRLTLPSLSEQDSPILHASWQWIDACWNELENRDLVYSTLDSCRFGAFPALPTLDVQYCSQLRRLSREGMIVSLLKSASELEEYAREAEYACANLIQILRPTFDAYEIEPPALPQPLPLTAYPLDFTPPQTTCPPWGMKVMEALNKVSAMTSEENAREEPTRSSYELCNESIQMVLNAFQQQDDEEQGARLGRKNIQVMDRLSKMQAHKRSSIAAIRDSYGRNSIVVQAADEFHAKAQQASCSADEKSPEDQVPLYYCSVLVRGSTGTLYVTATQMLFVTQFIPIVGGQTCTLFDLEGLSFNIQEGSSSLLMSPLPTSISVKRQDEEVYSFRPSHGAHRLVAFLNVIQAMANPDDGDLTFSSKGGLLYMYGDSPPPRRPY